MIIQFVMNALKHEGDFVAMNRIFMDNVAFNTGEIVRQNNYGAINI